ncbi:MAG: glutamate-5-semialdehyde dehydrogenase [Bacteroidaceae bacterium]|nr:glutamate-5-semialdehyde dehydrogenase [Bacteroidaceae bacterium]
MDIKGQLQEVHQAAKFLLRLKDEDIAKILCAVADEIIAQSDVILKANQQDLLRMDTANPKYDRLKLTSERLLGIASDMRNVAKLPSPVGKVLRETIRPNGLQIKQVSVPFGVIGIIYEARPNVSFDVFSLCLRSHNACVLKGGSDAQVTNEAAVGIIHGVLKRFDIDTHVVELLPSNREASAELLHARGLVDLIIPRGSSNLIKFVRDNATVPVIETGAGICHTYFDVLGDVQKGAPIIHNAKTRRVSVCNALDCVLLHRNRLSDLPALCTPLVENNVVIYADADSYDALEGHYPDGLLQHALPDSFGTEFLDYKMAIKTVSSLDEAISWINKVASGHSECIVTEDKEAADRFCNEVDAACVYWNAPTSFSDGAQFGLGAEIGISTQKLHARGPMALEALTTYKWMIAGNGQIRKG